MTCRELPVIGPFLASSRDTKWAIIWEVLIIFGFSTAPFWLPGILLSFLQKNSSMSYFYLARQTFSRGELLIAASGLLGPVILILSDHPKSMDASWTRKILLVAAYLIGFVAVAAYGFLRSYVYEGNYKEISEALVINVSTWMLVIATVIRFGAISYSKFQFEAGTLLKAEGAFANDFANRHKESLNGG